jgi:hypothetical protein
VDHYVAATGGAAALAAEQALHTRGHMEAAKLKGTVEQWTQVPDRIATRLDLGTLRLRMGYDGHVGWSTDMTSKRVRVLEGKELEEIASDAYFENEMWARPDQGGGKVAVGSTSFRGGKNLQLVGRDSADRACAPAVVRRGRPGLLARVVTHEDHFESTTWLSEYRAFAGRKRPALEDGIDQSLAALYDEVPVNRVTLDSAWGRDLP